MAVKGIDHVVVRVKDIEAGIESYKKMGFELSKLPDGTFIELVAPTSPDSAVGKAIESRGEGVHSVVITCTDFDQTIEDMKGSGAQLLGGGGMDGNAFVHPKSSHGVLVQIQQAK